MSKSGFKSPLAGQRITQYRMDDSCNICGNLVTPKNTDDNYILNEWPNVFASAPRNLPTSSSFGPSGAPESSSGDVATVVRRVTGVLSHSGYIESCFGLPGGERSDSS